MFTEANFCRQTMSALERSYFFANKLFSRKLIKAFHLEFVEGHIFSENVRLRSDALCLFFTDKFVFWNTEKVVPFGIREGHNLPHFSLRVLILFRVVNFFVENNKPLGVVVGEGPVFLDKLHLGSECHRKNIFVGKSKKPTRLDGNSQQKGNDQKE